MSSPRTNSPSNSPTISQPDARPGWKPIIRLGAFLCGSAVLLGAFGAHALETNLYRWYEADRAFEKLGSWQTAVQYQMAHGLALLFLGLLTAGGFSRNPRLVAGFFLLGVLVFSGFLYLWVLTDWKILAMLVPVGGVSFVLGWLSMCLLPLDQTPEPATLEVEQG